MDFAFSDEQLALRASVRDLMQARYPLDRVADIADSEAGFDASEWKALAEMGLTGISAGEDVGGAGLGFLEELVVVEELGRALYPGPYLSSVVLAARVLATAGANDLLRALASGERIGTVAWAGEDGRFDVDPAPKVGWDGTRLDATKLFVPAIEASDLVVVIGETGDGPGAWAVDRGGDGVSWRSLATVDATRRMGEVIVRGPAKRLALGGDDAVARVRDAALAALAVEAVGVGSRALELAVDHVRTREQFGRPIGAFQAVSHQLAQAFLEVETARSVAYWAGWAVAESTPEAPVAAAAAKARAADAAVGACERAIQVHGGIGFTWEHPLHRFYKRALGTAHLVASGDDLRARVARAVLD